MIETDLTPERRDGLLDGAARRIVQWGLETPAVLFLEMHQPLTFLAGQSLLVAMPFLGAFIDQRHLADWARLLQSRDNIDRLIDRIESLSGETAPATATEGAGDGAR
ncbi:hypothetical protein AMK68_03810 [candidate division KD3-62 bacterium DG_56]|uniref:Uncharacterized protein n=1 Tax=candidate division KD3-62 bacterium DG_56 TaxID=1704032 RepID=A0A0S7XM66_9BACT|nr:MAG: hypothetical protein AMK68_03810 [candidate division KD3-62 bacterium DG_56]